MSLLVHIIQAAHARSTHHKLALDALPRISRPGWDQTLLAYYRDYLRGAKAPDTEFKDFANHVLHVRQNGWGGACRAARQWYGQAVASLAAEQWSDAAFELGVVTHYYSDPLMPLHTGQSEAETRVHRAVEWSVATSYESLRARSEFEQGFADAPNTDGDDWLEQMVAHGASEANVHYEAVVDLYDFEVGSQDPPAGLGESLRGPLARLLGHAAAGIARIIDRATADADVLPPASNLTAVAFVAALEMPIRWVLKRMADDAERQAVRAIYDEVAATGELKEQLPEECRAVRDAAACSVEVDAVGHPSEVGPRGGPGSTPGRRRRGRLSPASDLVDAPSIGPKTAARLRRAGLRTVGDLLQADPENLAVRLNARHIRPQTIRDWQDQAQLVCDVPELRGHDAQILVACGVRTAVSLANARLGSLLTKATAFARTRDGERVIRSGKAPDRNEVAGWINAAQATAAERAA